ncbi:MAG TPA: NAD(P)/FAD-dependent oxidoreductase [Pirellulales bacterium]|nr:NAD(P)/FAD-dependent oxidoreductase [Pirellulales bacterium]
MTRTAVMIGAGPAGLTAASELLDRTDVRPIVLEMSAAIGGISQTVNYKGNRIDIGGHRFFSKSDRVMQWWLDRMPLELGKTDDLSLVYQGSQRQLTPSGTNTDPEKEDRVMLVRQRRSRIYFLRKFFYYPIRLNADTMVKLGPLRMVKIGLSYARAAMFPNKHPGNLEEFFISRFGRELYLTFFKSYTEKVWGESCSNISAEWGAQRIKGLSIAKALLHAAKSVFKRPNKDVRQKNTETSLIEQFLYPKFGPGQMWEIVAADVTRRGGEIHHHQRVTRLHTEGNRIASVTAVNTQTGQETTYAADFVFSTMPVRELIAALDAPVPANVQEVSNGLMYRDFITVGMLVKRLKVQEKIGNSNGLIRDNWIYVQEPDVKLGRLQVFNNWSPYMVADPSLVWIGLEYFCNDTDPMWKLSDPEMIELATEELSRIGIMERADLVDATVIRMPKTYPAYFGTYDRFDELRTFVDRFENLFLVGRNGMHKYNNQDHSMLTAMTAVDNIAAGRTDKSNIWEINTEQEYHESKGEAEQKPAEPDDSDDVEIRESAELQGD